MSRSWILGFGGLALVCLVSLGIAGCSRSNTPAPAAQSESPAKSNGEKDQAAVQVDGVSEEHAHKPGAHGGVLVSLGRDSYHVEAIVTDAGELRLYTLGNDESRVMDVEIQKLVAYVKNADGSVSASVELTAEPQPGDAESKSSLFVAKLPENATGQDVSVTVPNITIGGERFRLGFTTKSDEHADGVMPTKVADDDERKLYLTPGGLYTAADIEANGNVTASQKFKGFKAKHDLHPKPGDKICPVTLTLANPACTWIIGGKKYEFCCPPCVDNFLEVAKNDATAKDVKAPEEYVKR